LGADIIKEIEGKPELTEEIEGLLITIIKKYKKTYA
jgi:hypothetical protein